MARTALFLSPGADLAPAVALAHRADALGYESLWVTHGIGRDALLTLLSAPPSGAAAQGYRASYLMKADEGDEVVVEFP